VNNVITQHNGKVKEPHIKCVIWDLDNTIWDGILSEGDRVTIRKYVVEIIKTLDDRGILHSIASKNDYQQAMTTLRACGLAEYFLYPQINWNSKSSSVREIVKLLNIGIDTIALVDDQNFELEEIKYYFPSVLCINAGQVRTLIDMPRLNPPFIAKDPQSRRALYISEIERERSEEIFDGTKEGFLATLNLELTIASATNDDLGRAEELTVRTNQLNATGYTYSYAELDYFRQSKNHKLLVAGLTDRFGDYGKIGLALLDCSSSIWVIKLLLMSCRVMSRGIGVIILSHVMQLAKEMQVRLQAEFVPTECNRIMYVTYRFNGFKEIGKNNGVTMLENDLMNIQPFPSHITVKVVE
jgi:FkbH-like protein